MFSFIYKFYSKISFLLYRSLNSNQQMVLEKCVTNCLFSVKVNFTVMGIVMYI